MASQAWLEASLRRSASLGLEVLERASRRSVDWTSSGASQTPTTTDDNGHVAAKVPTCLSVQFVDPSSKNLFSMVLNWTS